jgi:hypothetical protein
MYDWRGFSSLSQFDSRSRRRCGNVETRVLCGFPSSEGGQNRCGRGSIILPLERHFHSEAPVYRPFCRECAVRAADGAEIVPFGKPRRMHDFTDSRQQKCESWLLDYLDASAHRARTIWQSGHPPCASISMQFRTGILQTYPVGSRERFTSNKLNPHLPALRSRKYARCSA